ncbi:MAG: membrane protein insertase YidC [Bacilli bacterium]|nr:membrane protein insertase YidC [Bacilli bacterium]
MNKKNKRILKLGALVAGLFVLSACTASFCSPADISHMLYNQDSGLVTTIENGVETKTHNPVMAEIHAGAESQGFRIPSLEYYEKLDEKVLNFSLTKFENTEGLTGAELNNAALKKYGYLKFLGTSGATTPSEGDALWGNWTLWTYEIGQEIGIENVPDRDFSNYYKNTIYGKIQANRSCIAIYDGEYGPEDNKIPVTSKTWKDAFDRGVIEGLFVYPIAAFIEVLTKAFGAGGWGQIWAILITTITVRGLLILVTLKQTIGAQKMQTLQPELEKIQQKYPNSDKNQYEKQALAQAQMALYKKHGVNPLGSILVMLLQFPIFIAVWGAMTGSASLASDAVMGLNLSALLGQSMINNWFTSGWWTAWVLFLLMTITQFISTRLSTWLNKSKQKELEKTTVNPAAEKQKKQSKMMMNIMFIMIIFMSFSLPAAMGVYWFAGAIISIAQTLIVHYAMKGKK